MGAMACGFVSSCFVLVMAKQTYLNSLSYVNRCVFPLCLALWLRGYRGLAPDVLRWFYLVPFDVLTVSLAPFTACAEVAALARCLFFPCSLLRRHEKQAPQAPACCLGVSFVCSGVGAAALIREWASLRRTLPLAAKPLI